MTCPLCHGTGHRGLAALFAPCDRCGGAGEYGFIPGVPSGRVRFALRVVLAADDHPALAAEVSRERARLERIEEWGMMARASFWRLP